MKFLNILISLALIVIGVGCQSGDTRTASRTSIGMQQQVTKRPEPTQVAMAPAEAKPISVQQVVTDKATYTIEVLPNPSPKLTPTSREGDKADRVYSSNIIAVYVHTNSGVATGSTNNAIEPAPENRPEP